MRIAFDARALSTSVAGVATYCRELLSALSESEPTWPLFLLTKAPLRPPYPQGQNLRPIIRSGPVWLQTTMPAQVHALRADVVHGLNHMAPLWHSRPTVITVHDLTMLTLPGLHERRNQLLTGGQLRLSLGRADMLIAVSDNTKRDVMAMFKVPGERIIVTHLAPASRYFPRDPDPAVLTEANGGHPLPARFILFVGALEPRKNVASLVAAFADLCADPAFSHDLVIAGAQGWQNSDVARTIQERGLQQRVHVLGYIDAELLPLLYSVAEVFVYPSLYEGFGLPPLEAMACGTPVICSNAGSLPEVVGNAARLIDPHNTMDLARALREVTGSAQRRAELREAGLARARTFSWKRTAELTIDTYREAIGRWNVQH